MKKHASMFANDRTLQAKVSASGRAVIPKPIRHYLCIKPGQNLDVSIDDGSVVMRPKKKVPKRWQDWRGILEGTNALQELMEEHRREIESGR